MARLHGFEEGLVAADYVRAQVGRRRMQDTLGALGRVKNDETVKLYQDMSQLLDAAVQDSLRITCHGTGLILILVQRQARFEVEEPRCRESGGDQRNAEAEQQDGKIRDLGSMVAYSTGRGRLLWNSPPCCPNPVSVPSCCSASALR